MASPFHFWQKCLAETYAWQKPCSARTLVASSKIQLGFAPLAHFGSIMGTKQ
jgi:hypothetical protein